MSAATTRASRPPVNDAAPPAGGIDPDRSRGWLRRMLPLLARHRLLVGVSLLGILATQLATFGFPLILRSAIDDALVAGSRPLAPFVWMLAGLAAARFLFGMLHQRSLLSTGALLQYDLRSLLQAHLGRQSFAYHDDAETGQLISRANTDIRMIQMFLTFAPAVAMLYAGFLVALVVMVRVHLGLTLVVLATMPLVMWIGIRMRRVVYPVAWLVQARSADIATIVEENLAGANVVRAMTAEADQIRRLDVAAQRLRWAGEREVAYRARYQPLIELLPQLGVALFVLVGGWLAVQGSVSIGTLVLFVGYIAILQAPFRMLGFLVMMGQRARASAQRVFEIVDHEPAIVDGPGTLRDPAGEVRFEQVRFAYDRSTEVLRGIDLHLRPGEKVALVGASGSGKSTLARLLPRFYDTSSGRVLVDGHDVRDLTLASLREHVGVVMDEAFLFTASIRDNIAYARPDASLDDVVAAAEAAGARSFIEELPAAWDTIVGERGYTLSGGQRQRIAIARTLLKNPRVLILDDATSAVDVKVEQEIHGALEHLLEGRTTLLIAHRIATIALADRVALLEDGRIVAEGNHEHLLATEPRYADVLAAEEQRDRARRSRRARPSEPVAPQVDDGWTTLSRELGGYT